MTDLDLSKDKGIQNPDAEQDDGQVDDLPTPGDVVVHVTSDVRTAGATREQLLVVIGHGEKYEYRDPKTQQTTEHVRLHAVPVGWADDYDTVPDTLPVPLVKRGEHAALHHTEWRRP